MKALTFMSTGKLVLTTWWSEESHLHSLIQQLRPRQLPICDYLPVYFMTACSESDLRVKTTKMQSVHFPISMRLWPYPTGLGKTNSVTGHIILQLSMRARRKPTALRHFLCLRMSHTIRIGCNKSM